MSATPTPGPLALTISSADSPLLRYGPWFLVTAAIALQYVVWHDTVQSLVAAWFRSGTFSHCPLIVLISATLIWLRRDAVRALLARPSKAGIALVVLLNAVWLAGEAAGVLSLQHFAVVAVVPAIALAVLGRDIARALAFPLAYLLFAVPVGESLVPLLIDFTARFTVSALRLVGIAVYQDGVYFSTAVGDFEVAKACSGVRYLIASVALGALFSHLMFQSVRRRLLFTLASIIVPLLANGLRAFLIVALAHLSNLRLAVGVDHLIYGWIFFGIVMLLLFLVGLHFREDSATRPTAGPQTQPPLVPASARALARCAIAAALCVAAGLTSGAWARSLRLEAPLPARPVELGSELGPWMRAPHAPLDWSPQFHGSSASALSSYASGADRVEVFVARYADQREGFEMISSDNAVFDRPHWHRVAAESLYRDTHARGEAHSVRVTYLRAGTSTRTVWHWYVLDDMLSSNEGLLKAHLAWKRLFGRQPAGCVIAIATAAGGNDAANNALLDEFVSTAGVPLYRAIEASP